MIQRIAIFVVVVSLLAGVLVYSQRQNGPLVVSGFIEADEIRLGSRVGGRVSEVLVEEGQTTTKNELLLKLEPFNLLELRAEALARLQSTEAEHARLVAGFRPEEVQQAEAHRDALTAELDKLEAGPRQQTKTAAEARLTAARAELKLATQNFDRVKKLFDRGATTQEQLDSAGEQLNSATAMVVVRQQEFEELIEGTRAEDIRRAKAMLAEAQQAYALRKKGYRREEIDTAKAAVDAARAALAAIDQQVAELEVRTPVAGVVEALELQPGDLVSAGAPVLSLVDTSNLWVRAYVPENHLDLSLGQKVSVAVDSYPDERFAGEITFVARQAEFTPNNVQTPEERSKQVFRIKVTLREGLDKLRPGMSADVYLEE
jgi:multidrug resistance efflux pump